MKLGGAVGLVSGGSNPTGPSNRQTKSVGRGLMSNPVLVFQQHNSNLIQSGFVVCAC